MAVATWPAGSIIIPDGLKTFNTEALKIKKTATEIGTDSLSSNVARIRVLNFMGALRAAVDVFQDVGSIPGIAAEAPTHLPIEQADVVDTYIALRDAAEGLAQWIEDAFPKDAVTGAWLVNDYDENGNPVSLTFTSAEMSGFRSRATTLVNLIS